MKSLMLIAIGILIALVVRWGVTQFTAFRSQEPANYSDQDPSFDIRDILKGEMVTEGIVFDPFARANTRFVATMVAEWDGDIGFMSEHFVYSNGREQDRRWAFQMGSNGSFTATAPDIIGVAQGQQSGSAVRLTYKIRLPEDVGGHVLDVVDWMYLLENGSVMNKSEFRKFGIKVGELVATFRSAP